jgi:hypothetical protein
VAASQPERGHPCRTHTKPNFSPAPITPGATSNQARRRKLCSSPGSSTDENLAELEFRTYDNIEPLEQVQIWDPKRGVLASWESPDYLVRQAAPDLPAAREAAIDRADADSLFATPVLTQARAANRQGQRRCARTAAAARSGADKP